MSILLSELARRISAQLVFPSGSDQQDVEIHKIAPIEAAGPGEVSFISKSDYIKFAKSSQASALIVKELISDFTRPQLVHSNPYVAFAKTAQLFSGRAEVVPGISDKAVISASARIGRDVAIYPWVYVGERCTIGDNVVLYPGVILGDDVMVGPDSVLHPHTVIYQGCVLGARNILHAECVIGADGFGYAVDQSEIIKIPQAGNVVIEDDVELGAQVTIDRAAMGSTIIRRYAKIDNKVQIAHNCEVGEGSMISALVGLAGSSKLGRGVIMGGLSAVKDHVAVASGTRIGGMTGVVRDIEEKGDYLGFPAVPAKEFHRRRVYLARIGELEKRVQDLEARLTSSPPAR